MNDAEFADEVARRLNRFLQTEEKRAMATLTSSLAHVGYANVAHFLGQLCLPHGMTQETPPEEMQNVKFLLPIVDPKERRINGFRTATGKQLQEEAEEAQKFQEEEAASEGKVR